MIKITIEFTDNNRIIVTEHGISSNINIINSDATLFNVIIGLIKNKQGYTPACTLQKKTDETI